MKINWKSIFKAILSVLKKKENREKLQEIGKEVVKEVKKKK